MAEKVTYSGGRLQTEGGTDILGQLDTTASKPRSTFRAAIARGRSSTSTSGVSATIALLGDSFTEGYTCSKRGLRWVDILARNLNGQRGGATTRYYPAACGGFSSTNISTDWPGLQQPWVYTGSVSGDVTFGASLHAAVLATSATISLTYFGDFITILYVRKTDAPSAAAVTLDGVAQTAINANGSTLPGQSATFGTGGDYGVHTLVVTATAAPLTVEGAVVHDGTTITVGIPSGTVIVHGIGHAGFSSAFFAGNTNWAASLAAIGGNQFTGQTLGLTVVALGANDTLGLTTTQFRDNLITTMRNLDTAITASGVTTQTGYLFVWFPTVADSYVEAGRAADASYAPDRCDHLDLRQYMPGTGTSWGTFDAGNGHPNDAGQAFIAYWVQQAIEGSGNAVPMPVMPVGGPIIEAHTPATQRSSWAESFGITGGQTWDTAGAPDTTVRERRHRTWLEAGTYQAVIRYEQRTTNGGTLQVLVGTHSVTGDANTSCGTQSTAGTDGVVTEVALGTSVTLDSPGAYPVTIRKTSANGTVRFVRLYLRKTA